jgi:hypothetical protein
MPSWQSLRLEATLFPRSDLLSLSDIHWNRVDELLGFGGARIEQNVLVTEDGCEVLTAAIPV